MDQTKTANRSNTKIQASEIAEDTRLLNANCLQQATAENDSFILFHLTDNLTMHAINNLKIDNTKHNLNYFIIIKNVFKIFLICLNSNNLFK